jgi:hypothetical protein
MITSTCSRRIFLPLAVLLFTLSSTLTTARPLHRLPRSSSSSSPSPSTVSPSVSSFNPFPTGVNISLYEPNIAGCEYPTTSVAVPQGCFALEEFPPLVGLFGDINVNSLSLTLINPTLNIWELGGYSDQQCQPSEYVFGMSPGLFRNPIAKHRLVAVCLIAHCSLLAVLSLTSAGLSVSD